MESDLPKERKEKPQPVYEFTSEHIESVSNGLQKFAIDLYHVCRSETIMPNFVISPISISAVLALVWAGAKEKTATKLKSLLHLEDLDEEVKVHEAFEQILKSLNPKYLNKSTLDIANRVYVDQEVRVKADYLALLHQHYLVKVKNVDFQSDVDRLRMTINYWVEEISHKRIKEPITHGTLDHLARAILLTCIHFKGLWQRKFYHDSGHPGRFFTDKDKTASMDVIQQQGRYPYTINKSLRCSAVELPYAGDRLTCILILPRDITGLSSLEAKITDDELEGLIKSMKMTIVNVMIPRFHVESSFVMADSLAKLGSEDVFSRKKADLSGMIEPPEDKDKHFAITNVYHRAQIDVGEEGGTSITGVPLASGGCFCRNSTKQFMADHPFLFVVRDKQTGVIILIGRVREPTPPKK